MSDTDAARFTENGEIIGKHRVVVAKTKYRMWHNAIEVANQTKAVQRDMSGTLGFQSGLKWPHNHTGYNRLRDWLDTLSSHPL